MFRYFLVLVVLTPLAAMAQVPSGSLVWLRSDKGVVLSNTRVLQWKDQSGNGNDAMMQDTTYQPLFLSSASNGLPAIKFNGSAYLQCPSVFPKRHDYTICAVARFDDGNPNNIVSGENHALFLYWDRTPRVQNQDPFAMRMSKIPFWESGFSCVVVPYTQFTQQAAIYVNGQEGARGYVGLNFDSTLYLGAYRKQFFLIGEIQEVLVYDRVLSPNEQNQLQSYLLSKYQIATATPLPKPDTTFTAIPKQLQLYARDADDSATTRISGNIFGAGFDSIYCIQFKDHVQVARYSAPLLYSESKAPFAFSPRIHAEPAEYKFEVHLVRGPSDTIIASVDSVSCGEVFLVDGQGNSSPAFISYRFQSEYCRTIGHKYSPDPADTLWEICSSDGGMVGAWPLRFQEELLEKYHLPSCCIDAAVGGSEIELHEPTDSNHYNLWSAYGKELYDASKSGIKDHVKVMLWDQGESNYAEGYYTKFKHLYDAWKQDYPSLKKIYLMQLRPNACYFGNIGMRDVQRWIADSLHDVETIAAAAIPGQDGCHYNDSGYMARCDRFFLPYARDFLGAADTADLRSPNPVWAWYLDSEHQHVAIVFRPAGVTLYATSDTTVGGNLQELKDYLYTNDTATKVASVSFDRDTMFVTFDRSTSAKSIGFTPDQYYTNLKDSVYEGPWIVNSRGYGALLWHDLPIHNEPMFVMPSPSKLRTVYPNPATRFATIDLSDLHGTISLRLINDVGRVVRNQKLKDAALTRIDYDGLPPALYRLEVRSDAGLQILNVVVQ